MIKRKKGMSMWVAVLSVLSIFLLSNISYAAQLDDTKSYLRSKRQEAISSSNVNRNPNTSGVNRDLNSSRRSLGPGIGLQLRSSQTKAPLLTGTNSVPRSTLRRPSFATGLNGGVRPNSPFSARLQNNNGLNPFNRGNIATLGGRPNIAVPNTADLNRLTTPNPNRFLPRR